MIKGKWYLDENINKIILLDDNFNFYKEVKVQE